MGTRSADLKNPERSSKPRPFAIIRGGAAAITIGSETSGGFQLECPAFFVPVEMRQTGTRSLFWVAPPAEMDRLLSHFR
jgi:hypothetical protein